MGNKLEHALVYVKVSLKNLICRSDCCTRAKSRSNSSSLLHNTEIKKNKPPEKTRSRSVHRRVAEGEVYISDATYKTIFQPLNDDEK
jgi:hypothetical protein